jgi:hypothetical protein
VTAPRRVELKRVRQTSVVYRANTLEQVVAALTDLSERRLKLAEEPTPDAAEQYGYCDAAIEKLLVLYSALTTEASGAATRTGVADGC